MATKKIAAKKVAAKGNPKESLVFLGMSGISDWEIYRQIERVFQSDPFEKIYQGRTVLRFLVDEALAGRAPDEEDLARALGKLDKSSDDSIARTAKTRLLARLETYYSQHAKPGEIRFVIREYIVFTYKRLNSLEGNYDSLPALTILEPIEGEVITGNGNIWVSGRVDALDPDLNLWIFVRSPNGVYLPQTRVSKRSPSFRYEIHIERRHILKEVLLADPKFEIDLVSCGNTSDRDFAYYAESTTKYRFDHSLTTLLPKDVKVLGTRKVIFANPGLID